MTQITVEADPAYIDSRASAVVQSALVNQTKWIFTGGVVAAERKVANNVWVYAGANADLNTSGSTCLFGGQLSASAATQVTDSTSWGIWSLKSIQTGNGNAAFGVYALRDGVTINSDTAVGDSALMSCLTDQCTGVGYGAGSRHKTGVGTNFFGSYAGWRGDKGDYNYIEGFYANSFTPGTDDQGVALGDYNWISGYFSAFKFTGNHSRIRGYEAAYNWVTGDHNFVDGYQAGASVTTGSHNIFIGFLAGSNALQVTGVNNSIALGKNSYTTKDNQIVIGGSEITETRIRGGIVVDPGLWMKSAESGADRDRIFFEARNDGQNLGSNYYRGHSNTPHIFQDRDGNNIFRLINVAEVRLEQLRVVNSAAQLAIYKDDTPSRACQMTFSGNNVQINYLDATAWRNAMTFSSSGTAAQIGFFGSTAVSKPTVSGSRGGNAALESLLTALANFGLITNSTSA